MTSCGCVPGTDENGWHEVRSPKCADDERKAFVRTVKTAMAHLSESEE